MTARRLRWMDQRLAHIMGTIRVLIDTRLTAVCRCGQPVSVRASAALEFPATTLHVASWEA